MNNFVVEFKLKTEIYQEDILEKRFEIARKIYNALVTKVAKRYHELTKTKRYRKIQTALVQCKNIKNKELRKQSLKELNLLYKEYGFSEYKFHTDVKEFQHYFKKNVDSFTAQKLATNLWKSYEKLLFGNGNKIHYKKFDSMFSIEGKSNKTGIRFLDNNLTWLGLKIPVVINKNNQYEQESLKNSISYCRIIRKFVRNKYKYYLQIIFSGIPPIKTNLNTGEIKHPIGKGRVGLDIGTQTLAISSEKEVKILELADRVNNIENMKKNILRKLGRSRRATNEDNFNLNGTIRKQGNKRVLWIKSNRYITLQKKLKELYRKQADVRKYQHEKLANEVISLGDNFYVEKMNFSGLQRRAKKSEVNEQGKFKRKKRFGKSLGNKAPSMFLNILERKLLTVNLNLKKIDTWSVKASQYNHIEDSYKKKKLSARWNIIKGSKVQRDMYSAFLIMNVSEDLKSVDKNRCEETYKNFLKLHNEEIKRLIGNKNLSSIGI
ncbi:transposase [Cetobacterium somerae]|uniref:transposase n=1 Tax=Cetobacterium somerae TaxID=188913 RepID=UPI002E7B01D0|nr:transposase [Cetobacterium somerae]WVJ00750.1 transposase [Cetobacterium somerae]